MRKIIVTTTINPPTEAIEKFDNMSDWHLIVTGDKKTPKDYALKNGEYLSPEDQEKMAPELSGALGWNCIQRRNMAFVAAQKHHPDVVAVVDDDNIPLDHWGQNVSVGQKLEVNFYQTSLPAFDPVGATNIKHLWHRGYPLELLKERDYSNKTTKKIKVDVQADFWNGDPDIDAICRMEHKPDVIFEDKAFPMSSNAIAPFNSQNTFISGKMLSDYFLFPGVGRMDDIWAAFYVQALGYSVVFERASVFQARNPHSLIKDMKAEFLGYEHNHEMVKDLAKDAKAIFKYLPENAIKAFEIYQKTMKSL